MGIQEITVKTRKTTGKEDSGRLRRAGLIPAVVYGLGMDSVPVEVSPKAVGKILQSEKGLNSVILLKDEAADRTRHVMIKDLDRHPVTDRLTHIDFIRLDMDKKVRAIVPVHIQGTPQGVKLGGILTIVRHELEVEALPADVPAAFNLDVTNLALDEAFRVKDVQAPEGVKLILGLNRTIAVVHLPETEVAKTEEEEA
ncbi:MAG: 50S ribosomal protein L25 [Acidobacteria bacterium]|nr:50S ribosomal protein L25 [Acidobacteriota bacterium]MCB9398349.1 50S ribosomal protein L25 [Acidobacteriota bacterium]